jgi:sugar-specific transcriptional regulator TrmB
MINPRDLLSKLDLSEAETDVYLAMLGGARTARDVIQATSRSRPTVYYALTTLEHRGLLSKTGLEENRRLRVEPLSRLQTMVERKQAELTQTRGDIDLFVRQFQDHHEADQGAQVSFYEGVTGVRNIIMETVYCHGRHIDTIVPQQNFFNQLGPEFAEHYVAERQRLGVSTRNLWANLMEERILKRFYDKADIRMMPQEYHDRFQTTIFMYDDCVLYISSLASGHGILVRSQEHVEFMKVVYELMWKASTPPKP